MRRKFVMTSVFDRNWRDIGFGDRELRELQNAILKNPQLGNVVPGCGGLRKTRVSAQGRGKRAGARVVYVDFPKYGIVYFFAAYPKNVQDDLTNEQRKNICAAISDLEKELERSALQWEYTTISWKG